MSACPSGIEKPGSVGTRPFWPCRRIVSMNRHGSSSKIADVSRPLPSRGVDGTITFIPGMCMNQASSVWECVAPVARPPYTWVRTVMGAVVLPAVMNRNLAALLISWSAAMPMKSMIMISATGSRPSMAAPTAAPTIAASEIGVSSTRSRPYFVDSPAVAPDAPGSAMSSPSRNTRSSACRAWSNARFSASRIVISFSSMCVSSDRVFDRHRIHVPVEFFDRGGVGAHHCLQRPFDLGERTFVDPAQLIVGAQAGIDELPSKPRHGVGRGRRLQLLLRDVRHPVAEVVTAEAECHALEESGAITVARLADRLGERSRDGERIVAVDANSRHAVAGRTVGDLLELHRVHGR